MAAGPERRPSQRPPLSSQLWQVRHSFVQLCARQHNQGHVACRGRAAKIRREACSSIRPQPAQPSNCSPQRLGPRNRAQGQMVCISLLQATWNGLFRHSGLTPSSAGMQAAIHRVPVCSRPRLRTAVRAQGQAAVTCSGRTRCQRTARRRTPRSLRTALPAPMMRS